jgi:hypothetical protein
MFCPQSYSGWASWTSIANPEWISPGVTYLQNLISHTVLGDSSLTKYDLEKEHVSCVIAQSVRLGSRGKTDDVPHLGDNVCVGPSVT